MERILQLFNWNKSSEWNIYGRLKCRYERLLVGAVGIEMVSVQLSWRHYSIRQKLGVTPWSQWNDDSI